MDSAVIRLLLGVLAVYGVICTLIWLLLASVGLAQNAGVRCEDRDLVAQRLFTGWGEVPVLVGLTHPGNLVEVWGNTVTGTWTITVTSPDGQTCLIGTGHSLAEAPKLNTDPPA